MCDGVLLAEPGVCIGVFDVAVGVCMRLVGVLEPATAGGPFCRDVLPVAGCLLEAEGEFDLVEAALLLELLKFFTERGRREEGDVGCDGGVWPRGGRIGT